MKSTFFTKYAIYLVPALMTFFFARNLVYTTQYNMDSWMGGGMRMFGAVDKMLYRVSGFTAEVGGKTYFVNLRSVEAFTDYDNYLRVMPKEERLAQVKKFAAAQKWCIDEAAGKIDICGKKIPAGYSPAGNLKVVSVSVYKTAFDPKTKVVSLKPIAEFPQK